MNLERESENRDSSPVAQNDIFDSLSLIDEEKSIKGSG